MKTKTETSCKKLCCHAEVQTATQTKIHRQVGSLGYCDFSVTALKCSTVCLHGAPCIIQLWLHTVFSYQIFLVYKQKQFILYYSKEK